VALHRKFLGLLSDRFTLHRKGPGLRLSFSHLSFSLLASAIFHSFYPTDGGSPADHFLFSQSQTANAGGR
jgi:hypothetical protein